MIVPRINDVGDVDGHSDALEKEPAQSRIG
jgi:hypothetical protein